jgi:hypothetical protein
MLSWEPGRLLAIGSYLCRVKGRIKREPGAIGGGHRHRAVHQELSRQLFWLLARRPPSLQPTPDA